MSAFAAAVDRGVDARRPQPAVPDPVVDRAAGGGATRCRRAVRDRPAGRLAGHPAAPDPHRRDDRRVDRLRSWPTSSVAATPGRSRGGCCCSATSRRVPDDAHRARRLGRGSTAPGRRVGLVHAATNLTATAAVRALVRRPPAGPPRAPASRGASSPPRWRPSAGTSAGCSCTATPAASTAPDGPAARTAPTAPPFASESLRIG